MKILAYLESVLHYMNEIFFFNSCAFLLFFAFLAYSKEDATPNPQPKEILEILPNEVQDTQLKENQETMSNDIPKITVCEEELNPGASFLGAENRAAEFSMDIDEVQLSFLMLEDVSGCDIYPESNFSRLRSQSMRTVQALIDNRHRMAERSTAARIKKERRKRANAIWRARHCRDCAT